MADPKINSVGQIFTEKFTSKSSVYDNGGRINGEPQFIKGAGLEFTSAESIEYDFSSYWTKPDAFSARFKIMPTVLGANRMLFQIGPSSNYIAGYITSDGRLSFQSFNGVQNAQKSTDPGLITANTKYEIVFAYDKNETLIDERIRIYVNGQRIDSGPGVIYQHDFEADYTPMLIANHPSVAGIGFRGYMNQVEFYDRALREDDVEDLFEKATYKIIDQSEAANLELRSSYVKDTRMQTTITGKADLTCKLGDGVLVDGFPEQLYPKGMKFDGANTYLQIFNNNVIQDLFDQGGAIKFIIRPRSDGEGGFGRVLDKGSWFFYTREQVGSQLKLAFTQTFTGTNGAWRTDLIESNNLYHVVMIYNSTDTNETPVLFINGQIAPLSAITNPSGTFISDTDLDLYVGDNVAHDRAYDGQVLGVTLYDDTLTETQVKWLYQKDINLINQ